MKAIEDTVIFVSAGFAHPGPGARKALRALLPPSLKVNALELLPSFLEGRDVPKGIVLYYHRKRRKRLDPRLLTSIERYLEKGGRILALHAATASFVRDNRYKALVGGRFVGHGPVENFAVEPVSEWARGLCPEFSVTDELYHHELADDLEIHFRAHGGEPVGWSRSTGEGELIYLSFGHTARVFKDDNVARVVRAAGERLFGEGV